MTTATPASFFLKTLTLAGPLVPDSEIQLSRGLNVVVGPSDTGKTFIAQCIDFMLGAGTLPKSIPEAKGYDTARLRLETTDGEELALDRSLSGGAFRLQRNGETTTLGEKHHADSEDTVSHLLLTLSGLTGRKVRTNARGATRTLSFRDIAHVIVVGEEDVIAERSPILSGHNTSKTAEVSVFRLLLTGADDSSLVERDEPKMAKGIPQGKKELLEDLLEKNSREIGSVGLDDIESEGVTGALEEAEQAVAAATSVYCPPNGRPLPRWRRIARRPGRPCDRSSLEQPWSQSCNGDSISCRSSTRPTCAGSRRSAKPECGLPR